MNQRQLFNNVMHYGEFDRMPILHWGGWAETRKRWLEEGMPDDIPEHEYFGTIPHLWGVGPNLDLFPSFEEEIYEQTDEYKVFKYVNGSIVKFYNNQSSLPAHVGYTLTSTGEGWDEYKKRLQPNPERIGVHYFQPGMGVRTKPIRPESFPLPGTFEQFCEMTHTLDAPVCVSTGSIFGWLRDWMGIEELAFLYVDNPKLLTEMIETICDLVVWGLEQVLPHVKVDFGFGWEDICFKNGPLISPNMMKEFGVPAYKRISETLRKHGVHLYVVDSDGVVDSLLPHWLDAGVNVTFPLEIGSWKSDPMELRKKFGKDLRIWGGIDKSQFALGPAAIDAELERRRPLMTEGGFIPMPDHFIPPDVSLDNYKYYLDKLSEMRF